MGGCLLPALEKGVLVLGVKGVAGEHEGLAGGGGKSWCLKASEE